MAGTRASFIIALVFAATSTQIAAAALNYSSIGSTYDQNFDTLANTGTDVPWANDSTLQGWYLHRRPSNSSLSPAVAMDAYDAGTGSSDSARFYSFGSSGSSERALGAIGGPSFGGATINIPFNSVIGWMAVAITNDTGSSLSQFTANFAGEQWRDAGNDPSLTHSMSFEYGYGISFDAVTSWQSPGGNFDWNSPVATSLVGDAVDGDAAGRVSDRGGTITNQTWSDGATLWLRWIERNDAGLDHGLAIDDFSFSATISAVPEPSAILFGSFICIVAGLATAVRKWRTPRRQSV